MNLTVQWSFFLHLLVLLGLVVLNAMPASAQDGSVRFSSRTGQPMVEDGVVYIGTEAGSLHAVDMSTGQELWSFETDGPVFHAPLLYGEMVIFGSQDGGLRSLRKSDGTLNWIFQAGEVDWEVRDIFVNGKPTIVDGIAYISSEDFNVYAIEVETGSEVWRHNLGEEPQARDIPIIDGTAYIGAWDGHLHALDIETGERVWRSDTDDTDRAVLPDQVPFVTVVPIVTDEAVYYSDWAGNLFAVDRATGKQIWRFDPHAADSRHVGSRSHIAMHENVIYYSTLEDKHLYGVDRRTGQQVWSVETEGIAYGPGLVGEGLAIYMEFIFGGANEGSSANLRILDLESREILWSTTEAITPPAVEDGIIYYGATDGTVHGRDLTSGKKVFRLGGL